MGRGDVFVSQHLRYRFDGYALREADRRGERVPCYMVGQTPLDTGFHFDARQTPFQGLVRDYGKQCAPCIVTVFFDKGYRFGQQLHTVITNIQSDLRNFLTYDGKELVDIDIKNCQPYLACTILNPLFWKKGNDLSLSLYSLPDNIQSALLQSEVITEIEDFFSKHQAVDFQPYINKVASGKFYEEFAALSATKLQKPITRKEAKTLMFYILFSSNQGQHSDPLIQQMKKIFSQEIYPDVAELFKIIKRNHRSISDPKQHNRLARLLQNIESEIILRRCCKRIWEEGQQQVPIFTIHDCIATIPPHKDLVEKVMQEELTQAIGIPPSLGIETWGIAAVKHPELLN